MAFPILLALAAAQAYSGYKQSEEIKQAAELQNALNEINAEYTEHDAYEAYKFGETEAAAYEPKISQTIGAQRTAYASEGVDVGYGTAAEVQKETRLTGQLNIIDIQNAARMKSLGLRQQADNIRRGMSVTKSQAEINADATLSKGALDAGATGYRGATQYFGDNNPQTLGGSNKSSGNRVR